MRRSFLPVMLLLAAAPARAGMLIGAANDIGFSPRSQAVFLRAESGPWGVFVGSWPESNVIGADATYYWRRFFISLGAAYLTRTNDINGTYWNFEPRAGVALTKRLDLVYTHFSNCKDICGFPFHGPNKGWNFLGLQYRF